MNLSKSALVALFMGGVAMAAPASAAPLLFNFTGQSLTGPVMASFQLDSNPVPSRINDQPIINSGQIFFDNVPGVFNGVAQTASSISFGTGLASAFQISGTTIPFAQFAGAPVFTGPLTAPVFRPGTFSFTGFSNGTLIVSQVAGAVPEPATWAMLITGFGGIGVAMRRRAKVRTTVAYA